MMSHSDRLTPDRLEQAIKELEEMIKTLEEADPDYKGLKDLRFLLAALKVRAYER